MRALTLPWSSAFSLVCGVALIDKPTTRIGIKLLSIEIKYCYIKAPLWWLSQSPHLPLGSSSRSCEVSHQPFNHSRPRPRPPHTKRPPHASTREEAPPLRRSSRPLGPLHTWAKSRDHEIVRAQKRVFKGRPKTSPKSCSVVTDSQV